MLGHPKEGYQEEQSTDGSKAHKKRGEKKKECIEKGGGHGTDKGMDTLVCCLARMAV